MTGQHTAEHHEVCAAAKRLRHIARHGATAVTDDLAAQAMRRIGTFDNGGQLRIPNAGFDARGAYGARANAHFHDVGTGEDQLFTHFTGHHVARDDGFRRPGLTRLADELYEVLGVTVRHINTNEVQRRVSLQDLFGLLEIRIGGAGGDHHVLHHISRGGRHKRIPLFRAVMFVYGGEDVELCQRGCHLKGSHSIHVGSDDRHARPGLTGMFKGELTFEFNV